MKIKLILIILGLILIAVSLLADQIGIGEGGVMGYKQITGAAVGAAVLVFAFVWKFKK